MTSEVVDCPVWVPPGNRVPYEKVFTVESLCLEFVRSMGIRIIRVSLSPVNLNLFELWRYSNYGDSNYMSFTSTVNLNLLELQRYSNYGYSNYGNSNYGDIRITGIRIIRVSLSPVNLNLFEL